MDPSSSQRVSRGSREFFGKLIDDLLAYAEHEFELDQEVGESGSTLRDNLRQVEKTTGETPEQLIGPDPPDHTVQYLFAWFIELHTGRRITASGLAPLGYDEIYYWQELTGRKLRPYELKIIRLIDNKFLEVHYGGSRKTRNSR